MADPSTTGTSGYVASSTSETDLSTATFETSAASRSVYVAAAYTEDATTSQSTAAIGEKMIGTDAPAMQRYSDEDDERVRARA